MHAKLRMIEPKQIMRLLSSKLFLGLSSLLAISVLISLYIHSSFLDNLFTRKLDIRITGKKIVHPYVDLFENGTRVYYTDIFFNEEIQSKPKRGSCNKFTVEIDPYEEGPSNEKLSGGLYPDCAEIHFSYSNRLPTVALATAPGSGSTWVRHLIQQLTGK